MGQAILVLLLLMLTAGSAGAQPDVSKGQELFRTCAGCHNVNNDQRKMGPSLRSLFGRVLLRNGKRANDDNVRAIVLNGYNGMPPFRYSFRPEDIDDLMAYLHTLTGKPAAAETPAGSSYFQSYCARCHKPADLAGRYQPEWLQLIAEGHKGAPPMKQWLDAAGLQALIDYLKSLHASAQ